MTETPDKALETWRRQVNDVLWTCFEQPLTEVEVELYWPTGLSPMMTSERIISDRDRQRDVRCES